MSDSKGVFHNFNVQEAKRYGVEKAVVLSALRHFLSKNMECDSGNYYYENSYWFTISARELSYILPYYTQSKVQRLLKQLETEKAVLTNNFNESAYDRTKWYSLPEFYMYNEWEVK